ncbi:MAG TPA: tyrosine-type recombinase/integrase [Ignavibacteria bacterium]|nr:tyrosine-type recombinase/integrase [Ignavibacteria bacterium]
MNSKRKQGVLLQLIKDFIKMRHNLGYKSTSMESSLKAFDAFAYREGLKEITIPRELALKWCKRRKEEASDTWSHRTNFLRQFSIYLSNMGYEVHIPTKSPSRHDSTFVPYIYSAEEIKKIFKAADQLRLYDRHSNTLLMSVPLMVRMLYATGIRIGEAVHLNIEDVNLEENYLVIKNGKNGQDRMVPFSESLAEGCQQYLDYRNRLPNHCNRFFVKSNGCECPSGKYTYWWNKILHSAGIKHRGKIPGPRIHDLRHTFRVKAMHDMSVDGKDIYYSLPKLSTCIGHQSSAATDRYVRLTSEMYPELIDKIEHSLLYLSYT